MSSQQRPRYVSETSQGSASSRATEMTSVSEDSQDDAPELNPNQPQFYVPQQATNAPTVCHRIPSCPNCGNCNATYESIDESQSNELRGRTGSRAEIAPDNSNSHRTDHENERCINNRHRRYRESNRRNSNSFSESQPLVEQTECPNSCMHTSYLTPCATLSDKVENLQRKVERLSNECNSAKNQLKELRKKWKESENSRKDSENSRKDSENSRKDSENSNETLKRLFIALCVINLLLIICVIAVVPVMFWMNKISSEPDPKNHKENEETSTAPIIGSKPAEEKDTNLCSKCSNFPPSMEGSLATVMDGNSATCCLKNIGQVFSEMDKRNQEIRNQIPSRCCLRGHGKDGGSVRRSPGGSFIHLTSKRMHKDHQRQTGENFNIQWSTPKHGRIQQDLFRMENNDEYLRIPANGHYYVYTRVLFKREGTHSNKTTTESFPLGFQIKHRPQTCFGQSCDDNVLAEVSQHCAFRNDQVDHVSSINTILALKEGDKLYVTVSSWNHLGTGREDHYFGMFKLDAQ